MYFKLRKKNKSLLLFHEMVPTIFLSALGIEPLPNIKLTRLEDIYDELQNELSIRLFINEMKTRGGINECEGGEWF